MSGRVPPSSRAGKRQRVAHPSEQVRRGAALFQRFSGHEAEVIGKVNIAPPPPALVAIGELDGVMYTTVRDGKTEKYLHKFAAKDKPVLAVSPNGKQLYLVGGFYTFTERGIVDRTDKSR
jgi:hypothetical protein